LKDLAWGFSSIYRHVAKLAALIHVDALLNLAWPARGPGSPESRSSQGCARRPIRVCAKLNTRDSRGMTPRALLRLRVGQPGDGATGDSRLVTAPTFAGGDGGNGKAPGLEAVAEIGTASFSQRGIRPRPGVAAVCRFPG
jgi:hypothetical protein